MSFLIDWWNRLSGLQQGFALVAVPASLILILQTLLLAIGMGHGHDGDMDTDTSGLGDHDMDDSGGDAVDFHDHDGGGNHDVSGLRILTVRGMVAFFAIGGWSGIVASGSGASVLGSMLIAFAAGLAALLMVAYFFKWALSLQENGTLSFSTAVGKTAEVYIRVPAARVGKGKVNILIGERLCELEAVTDSDADLRPGQQVNVAAVEGQILIVSNI